MVRVNQQGKQFKSFQRYFIKKPTSESSKETGMSYIWYFTFMKIKVNKLLLRIYTPSRKGSSKIQDRVGNKFNSVPKGSITISAQNPPKKSKSRECFIWQFLLCW